MNRPRFNAKLKPGATIVVGPVRLTYVHKSGQVASLIIEADPEHVILQIEPEADTVTTPTIRPKTEKLPETQL